MSGRATIAAIEIGQSPRPDLLRPLRERVAADAVEIVEVGALDRLSADQLAAAVEGGYPLTTRLRDGSRVTLDEDFLAPHVQAAINEAEERGAIASLLLCAGGFRDLRSTRPLIRPFEVAAAALTTIGIERILVVVPTAGQVAPASAKWTAAGLRPRVEAARLGEVPSLVARLGRAGGDALVLDYVGHPPDAARQLRSLVDRPVLDLGDLAAATLASLVGPLRPSR